MNWFLSGARINQLSLPSLQVGHDAVVRDMYRARRRSGRDDAAANDALAALSSFSRPDRRDDYGISIAQGYATPGGVASTTLPS
jgi:hypothetical protein